MARIRVNVQKNSIAIQASEQNIELIEQAMEDLFASLIEEDFDISWTKRLGGLNDAFIAPIAKLTDTFIERMGENTVC
jgi:Mitochondrial inner-membrane-bound regulator